MSDFLDDKYPVEKASDELLRAVRQRSLRDMKPQKPARSWQTEALILFGASFAVFLVAAIALLATGNAQPELIKAKWNTLLPLLVASALCAFSAMAPKRRGFRIAAVIAGAIAAAILLVGRMGMASASSAPEWLCTGYHVSVAILPIVVALQMLRTAAPNPLRAAVAGLAAGTTGAMLGELACLHGVDHAAVFHLGAWGIVVALCLLMSMVMPPRSYAP